MRSDGLRDGPGSRLAGDAFVLAEALTDGRPAGYVSSARGRTGVDEKMQGAAGRVGAGGNENRSETRVRRGVDVSCGGEERGTALRYTRCGGAMLCSTLCILNANRGPA